MKRLSTIFLAVLLLAGLFPAAAVGEDAGLSLSCPSAILMEKETGTILYEQDAHQKLEPASVTKIMTLLLVMEAVDSGRLPWTTPSPFPPMPLEWAAPKSI